jgi:hypothetical protein
MQHIVHRHVETRSRKDHDDMKWVVGVLIAFLVLTGVYVGSAVVAIGNIVADVQSGNVAAIMARTDVARVRHALIDQIIAAYLGEQAKKGKPSAFKQMAVGAYGAAIADAMISKLMTPENLSALLRTGAMHDTASAVSIVGVPALADLDVDRVFPLLARFQYVKPVEFAVRLGSASDDAAISLHFQNWSWRLSGVRLPTKVVSLMIARLPAL